MNNRISLQAASPDGVMKGKTCLITGGTSGMGEATARALARLGATVVIVGRDPARAADAVDRIKRQTGSPAAEFLLAELSSQAAIRTLAEQFMSRHGRLDVLVNNAGALFLSRRESADGIEMTLALNHLAYFLLTRLLLATLKENAPARIVNVSSYGHRTGKVNFDDLQGKQRYSGMAAYRQSKLANILFTLELSPRLAGSGVTVNAVAPATARSSNLNPGLVASNFGLSNFRPRAFRHVVSPVFKVLYRAVAMSPEQGAQTAIHLATSPEVEGISGAYFENGKTVAPSPAAQDAEAAGRLWQVSEELTGLGAAGN